MHELPADLAAPLHLPNPYATYWSVAAGLGALLLLGLVWLAVRRLRARTPLSTPAPASPPPAGEASGIAKVIAELRVRFLRSQDYRAGCHELAETLRSHLEPKTRTPLSTLTAREIKARLGDGALAALFELLAELQFRRRDPGPEEFGTACDMATMAVAQARKR